MNQNLQLHPAQRTISLETLRSTGECGDIVTHMNFTTLNRIATDFGPMRALDVAIITGVADGAKAARNYAHATLLMASAEDRAIADDPQLSPTLDYLGQLAGGAAPQPHILSSHRQRVQAQMQGHARNVGTPNAMRMEMLCQAMVAACDDDAARAARAVLEPAAKAMALYHMDDTTPGFQHKLNTCRNDIRNTLPAILHSNNIVGV